MSLEVQVQHVDVVPATPDLKADGREANVESGVILHRDRARAALRDLICASAAHDRPFDSTEEPRQVCTIGIHSEIIARSPVRQRGPAWNPQ